MKKLSLVFGVLAILFLSYGLYELFNLSVLNERIVFASVLGGFLSSTMFLLTDKMSEDDDYNWEDDESIFISDQGDK